MNRKNFLLTLTTVPLYTTLPAIGEVNNVPHIMANDQDIFTVLNLHNTIQWRNDTPKIISLVNAIRGIGLYELGLAIYHATKQPPNKCVLVGIEYRLDIDYTADPKYPYNG